MGAMLIKCVLVLQKEQAERSQTKPLEKQHVGFVHISGRIYFIFPIQFLEVWDKNYSFVSWQSREEKTNNIWETSRLLPHYRVHFG